jgi:hypothetical protein
MFYYLRTWLTSAPLAQGAAVPLAEGAAVIRLATFGVGTAALCVLSRFAGDPAWDIPCSLLMATACYLTAPTVVRELLVRRRVTARSIVLWYASVGVTFDLYQLARTGQYHFDWMLGNLAGSTVLYVLAGLIWNVNPRQLRHFIPAGAASFIGVACLVAWTWWP